MSPLNVPPDTPGFDPQPATVVEPVAWRRLVKGLFALASRLRANKHQKNPEPVDINRAINKALAKAKHDRSKHY